MNTGSKRVTLKDISDICGYSVNTVSLALRDDPKLPEETRSKIKDVASSLGYIRNSFASSLRSGKSNLVAIIVDDILNLYYAAHIVEMEDLLRAKGYTIMILCTHSQPELERQMLLYAVSHGVDGIILAPISNKADSAEYFRSLPIPLVLVDREIPGRRNDLVCMDDYAGGRLAGQTLIRSGHRSFLYISGPASNNSQVLREKGLKDVLEETVPGAYSLRVIARKKEHTSILCDWIRPLMFPVDYTAVVAFNDDMAYEARLSLEMKGCADRVTLIGFDHIRSTFHYLPPLSSIACASGYDMARAAVDQLLWRIAHPEEPVRTVVLPVELYEGEAAGNGRSQRAKEKDIV